MKFWSRFLISSSLNKANTNDKKVGINHRLRALKNIPPFFKLIWETTPWLLITNMSLRLVRAVQPLGILYIARLIMNEVVSAVGHHGKGNYVHILQLLGIELLLAVLNDVLGRSIALTDGLMGDKFANETSIRLMKHAAALDMSHFENSEFYDKLERARRQTLNRSLLMAQILGQFQETITLVILAVGIAAFNPWLLLLLLVSVIPAFLGESHFNERSYSLIHGWTPQRRELDYLRYTGTSDENAKEVKIFGLSDFIVQKYRTLSHKFFEENKSLSLRRALWGSLWTAIATGAHYITYAYIIFRTVYGNLTIGDLTFFLGSFGRMRTLLDNIFSRFSGIAEGALFLEDLFGFFEIKSQMTSPSGIVKFPSKIQKGFTFENVGYKYPFSEKWALKNLNFTILTGEKLALVGENGAGKTTLVKLITRLYDPTEGRILLDGIDLRDFDIEEYRKETGVIFQDFVRYQMNAATNIAIGRIEEKDNKERVYKSSVHSLADKVIEKLPAKYDQMIGKKFADGVELSGGEWQKIGLARAYMRDAQVIILDEPTAALDARAEHEVFQRFSELTKGKIAVLISHRFSTVRMADRILVIENGQMVELGSHESLLTKNGRYAELFHLQARGYK